MDLALGCDIRIMTDGAKLAAAFTSRGVVPESGGTWILPRLIGWSKASEIIFTGNIQRFNDDRGLKFIIRSFLNEEIPNNLKLKIIGWPLKEVQELREFVNSLNLNHCVEILDRLDRKLTIAQIEESSIGLLINSSNNLHSYKHTSPLKYFEYLYGELNILAVDFPSHRSLPFSDNITFFNENDEEGFIKALLKINKNKIIPRSEVFKVN